jgi:hypothetical protein
MSLIGNAFSMEATQELSLENKDSDLELEQAAGEIEVADRSVEKAEMEQEELETVAATMESIHLSLESAISDETGLTRREAAAHRLTIQHALRGALPMPVASLESFGGEGERIEATTLSMEGIGDVIKKVYEAIKRAVSNAINAVSVFFSKLIGGVKKLREKAEDTLKKVKENKGKLDGDRIKSAKGLDRIHLKGKTSMSDILTGANLVASEVESDVSGNTSAAKDFYQAISKIIKDRKEDATVLETAAADSGYTKSVSKFKSVGKPLPGGKMLSISGSSEETNGIESKSIPKLKVMDTAADKTPADDEATGVTLAGLEKLLTYTVNLLKNMEDSAKSKEALKKTREEVLKETESLAKDAEKLTGKVGGFWTQTTISAALRSANVDLNTNISRCDAYMFGWARGAVQFASHAEGEFKEEAA